MSEDLEGKGNLSPVLEVPQLYCTAELHNDWAIDAKKWAPESWNIELKFLEVTQHTWSSTCSKFELKIPLLGVSLPLQYHKAVKNLLLPNDKSSEVKKMSCTFFWSFALALSKSTMYIEDTDKLSGQHLQN